MDIYRIMTIAAPDGEFHIIIDGHDVARASGFGSAADLVKRFDPSLAPSAVEQIENHPYQNYVLDYYNGVAAALDQIPGSQSGTEFQKRVWHAMATIPYGHTVSYKQLADISGNPAAIRAAGTICGLNKLILLVPCHRILKSDGSIGSYLYGPTIKESLLRHEGAIS